MDINSDVLITQIIPLLSLGEIKSFCQVGSDIRKICQDERVWQNIFMRDFPYSGPKQHMSWYEFYFESYKYQKMVHETYPDASTRPNNIPYSTYYQLLGTATKPKLIFYSPRIDEEDIKLGDIYVIPEITTLASFLQEIEQRIKEKAGYVGDYGLECKVYTTVFGINRPKTLYPCLLCKVDNKYIARDSFGNCVSHNALRGVFKSKNLEIILYKEDHCPFAFSLSDEHLKTYLLA